MNDKRLKLAKEALESGSYDKETIEYIFPELKESEDEKIRKEILDYFRQFDNGKLRGVDISNWISWLKKQEKVKHTCRNCKTFQDLHQNCPYSPIYQYIDLTEAHKHLDDETHCEFWLEKQGEQKSSWSEDDEEMKRTIISNLFILKGMYTHPDKQIDYNNMIEWLKSLKPQSHWKPTQEQMTALKIVKNGFPSDDLDAIESLYNDLKKL